MFSLFVETFNNKNKGYFTEINFNHYFSTNMLKN